MVSCCWPQAHQQRTDVWSLHGSVHVSAVSVVCKCTDNVMLAHLGVFVRESKVLLMFWSCVRSSSDA
eukprot:scaffold19929_cov16-Tisochrysis_lutea.AAC.1